MYRVLCIFLFLFLFLATSASAEYRASGAGDNLYWVQENNSLSQALSECTNFVESVGYADGAFLCAQYGVMNKGWPEDGLPYVAAGWLMKPDPDVLAFFLYHPVCQSPTKYNRSTQKCEKRCPASMPWDAETRDCEPRPESIPGSCPSNLAGNPIDFFSGYKIQTEPVFSTKGRFPLTFSWNYNSMGNQKRGQVGYSVSSNFSGETMLHSESTISPYAQPIEMPLTINSTESYTGSARNNWRTNHSYFLAHYTPDGHERLVAYRPNGYDLHFTDWGAGHFVSTVDPGIDVRKETDADGEQVGWVLHKGRKKERYDMEGRIIKIIDKDGGSLEYEYAGSGNHQTKISDEQGHTVFLAYDGENLARLTRDDGRVYRFEYSDNILKKIIFPGGTFREFEYEDARFPNALTGIVDEDGHDFASFSYDSSGRAIASQHAGSANSVEVSYLESNTRLVKNSLGKETVYHYGMVGGANRIEEIDGQPSLNCAADSKSFDYDSTSGFIYQKVERSGAIDKYSHDRYGNITRELRAKGTSVQRTVEQEWNASKNALLSRKIYNSGGSLVKNTSWTVNDRGQHVFERDIDVAHGYERDGEFKYCESEDISLGACPLLGLLVQQDGPRQDVNDTTSYQYDSAGNLTSITNPLGQTTQITQYDPDGNPRRIIDLNGVKTDLQYDSRQRLISKTEAVGLAQEATTTFQYDAVGQLKAVTLPDASSVTYYYDTAHRLTAVEDSFGDRVEYTFDNAGNRISETVKGPSSGVVKQNGDEYDSLSRAISQINGVGDQTSYSYDVVGNLTSKTDAAGNETSYQYDPLNRLTKTIDALNGSTSYSYDDLNNLTQVVDPRGVTTTYDYDAFGDRLAVHSPDSGTTTYTYDAAGNVITKTDARGITATYTYDALNRVTSVDYPGTDEDITYTYDQGDYGIGHLMSYTDESGSTSFTYGPRGNVLSRTQVTDGVTLTTAYQYDLADHVTRITYPSGMIVHYQRDAMGRVSAVTADIDGSTHTLASNITHEPFGGIKTLDYGNGLAMTRRFDLAGRLTQQAVPPVQDLSWTYSNIGNITAISDGVDPDRSQTLGYDALSRLTSASGAYGDLAYQYDAVGNRTQLDNAGTITAYTYATDSNRLGTINGQAVPFDAAGNILQLNGQQFSYSDRNRLATTGDGGGTTASSQYNADGQRVVKNNSESTTEFLHDLKGHLLGEYNATGSAIREYVYLDSKPLSLIKDGSIYLYHNDQIGTPSKLSDMSKTVVWDSIQKPFGNLALEANTVDNPLRMPGQYSDFESGLYQNGRRDYSPVSGRYLESDPIGLDGGVNTYAYVSNDPMDKYDPSGRTGVLIAPQTMSGIEALGTGTLGVLGAGAVGVTSAGLAGYGLGSLIYPHIAQPLGDAIDAMCRGDEQDDNCEALYQSILRTCAGLQGKKRFKCFEAARIARDQCYQEKR